MLIVIDAGNTNIKLGLYEKDELKAYYRFSTDRKKTADEYAIEFFTALKTDNIDAKKVTDGAIISCVVPQITAHLVNAVKKIANVTAMVVGAGIKTGLNIRIEPPESTGSDLVASCVEATQKYPCPCIVIGLGTATTMCAIDKNKAMIGGVIAPGISISLDALTSQSALLPSVGLEAPKKVIGRKTTDCIMSGIVWGNVCMLDGMIDKMENEIGEKCTVIATGGNAPSITKYCSHDIILDENLILEGLKTIYYKNI